MANKYGENRARTFRNQNRREQFYNYSNRNRDHVVNNVVFDGNFWKYVNDNSNVATNNCVTNECEEIELDSDTISDLYDNDRNVEDRDSNLCNLVELFNEDKDCNPNDFIEFYSINANCMSDIDSNYSDFVSEIGLSDSQDEENHILSDILQELGSEVSDVSCEIGNGEKMCVDSNSDKEVISIEVRDVFNDEIENSDAINCDKVMQIINERKPGSDSDTSIVCNKCCNKPNT